MSTIDNKTYWSIIDALRDDINAHIDAITDLNDCVDKLQKENKKLKDELNEAIEDSNKAYKLYNDLLNNDNVK